MTRALTVAGTIVAIHAGWGNGLCALRLIRHDLEDCSHTSTLIAYAPPPTCA